MMIYSFCQMLEASVVLGSFLPYRIISYCWSKVAENTIGTLCVYINVLNSYKGNVHGNIEPN